MVDIEKLKLEIVNSLSALNPDKIILFGSYAYGSPNDESDIDLFLVKDGLKREEQSRFEQKARKSIRNIIFKYGVGFDILSSSTEDLKKREDYFYKIDILKNGILLNE